METWHLDYLVAIAISLAVLGAVYVCLSGLYKGWLDDHRGPTLMLAGLPGGGLILLIIGLGGLLDLGSVATTSMMILVGASMVAAFVITVLKPSWWGPRWYREHLGIGARRAPGEIGRHPVVEPVYRDGAGVRSGSPRNPIHRAMDDEEPIDSWQATLIQDFHRATGYRGRLTLYPEGLAFLQDDGGPLAESTERRVGLEMLAIDIVEIHVLPKAKLRGGDGPDAPMEPLRPATPWLVVRMRYEDQAHVFSVAHVAPTARRISEHLGCQWNYEQ